MNDDGTEITNGEVEPGAIEQSGGSVEADTTAEQAQELYDDLGIKAKVPTDNSGRKSDNVRAKNSKSKDAKSTEAGEEEASDDTSKSKTAPDSNKNSDNGDKTNPKGEKDGDTEREVHGDAEKSSEGNGEEEPEGGGDPERGSEDDADGADDDATREDDVKRPGKSNPKTEQRFQKLTSEIKERDEQLQKLQQELEQVRRQQWEDSNKAEDPEYTIDDFKTVRNEYGEVLDLDEDQQELAYRRWRDGYESRKAERESEYSEEQAAARYAQDAVQRVMESSARAYDTLTSIRDEMPELDETSDRYDADFAKQVLPIINESIIYQPGTEPGNQEGIKPVIVGLKIDPRTVITAMNAIRTAKRAVPLNGLSDSVESSSNKTVTHSRSSDPLVNQANDLYKSLGIKTRL